MKISINVPSYRRPDKVGVLKYLPMAKVWVDGSEFDQYKKNYPDAQIMKCPDGIQGRGKHICLNYVYDQEFKQNDAVCIIDDDIGYIGYFNAKKRVKIESDEFMAWLIKYSNIADELGARLWGVNVNFDPQSYREYTPFSMTSPILAPFNVLLKCDLRYDLRFVLKHDYDFFIQHMARFRRVLRLNKFHYDVKQTLSGSGASGGSSLFRNIAREEAELRLLQKKWGRDIVRIDFNSRSHSIRKNKRGIDLNPLIRIPIRGV